MIRLLRTIILALLLGCSATAKGPVRADMVSRLEPWRELEKRRATAKAVIDHMVHFDILSDKDRAAVKDAGDLYYSYQLMIGTSLIGGDYEAYDRYIKEANREVDRMMAIVRKVAEGQIKDLFNGTSTRAPPGLADLLTVYGIKGSTR